ncbi:hypothetical protein CC1G_12791 [Coprinopsis cinerea okayama7|uniref:Uncharacterized protein n=1 Tax=Coprinopsis cinerea (strain Okayama-7 / 130 / ATCC MYA-4618 / FGSC 9003) TaxID=240176 RepID=A8P3F8_COPC7|nr:hypothetical protein CC1G_12791 [Coprinopsis cinerea okayama7\|eukprot:XP_001838540.1 hypothetical protein CC1G_12791 [Coprinopsis cinerea okayama7\
MTAPPLPHAERKFFQDSSFLYGQATAAGTVEEYIDCVVRVYVHHFDSRIERFFFKGRTMEERYAAERGWISRELTRCSVERYPFIPSTPWQRVLAWPVGGQRWERFMQPFREQFEHMVHLMEQQRITPGAPPLGPVAAARRVRLMLAARATQERDAAERKAKEKAATEEKLAKVHVHVISDNEEATTVKNKRTKVPTGAVSDNKETGQKKSTTAKYKRTDVPTRVVNGIKVPVYVISDSEEEDAGMDDGSSDVEVVAGPSASTSGPSASTSNAATGVVEKVVNQCIERLVEHRVEEAHKSSGKRVCSTAGPCARCGIVHLLADDDDFVVVESDEEPDVALVADSDREDEFEKMFAL